MPIVLNKVHLFFMNINFNLFTSILALTYYYQCTYNLCIVEIPTHLPSVIPSLRWGNGGWSPRPPLCFLVGLGLWLWFWAALMLLSVENGLVGLGLWEEEYSLPKKQKLKLKGCALIDQLLFHTNFSMLYLGFTEATFMKIASEHNHFTSDTNQPSDKNQYYILLIKFQEITFSLHYTLTLSTLPCKIGKNLIAKHRYSWKNYYL